MLHRSKNLLLPLALALLLVSPRTSGSEETLSAKTGAGACIVPSLESIPVGDFKPHPLSPVSSYTISQGYNNGDLHLGLDMVSTGDDDTIRSSLGGMVVATSTDGPWGISVGIASRASPFSDEIMTFHYHHLEERYFEVSENDCPVLDAGASIGKEGSTGNSTGDHLHLSVRRWANLEHLQNWLSSGKDGQKLWWYAYPDNVDAFRGSYEPALNAYDPESPYAHFGSLNPAPLLQDYYLEFLEENPPHGWAEDIVRKVRHYGIAFGEWTGDFGLDRAVTRREMARWLRVAVGDHFSGSTPAGQLFSDVQLDDPDTRYIQELTTYPATPVIDPDGLFEPDREVNRAEALKMVVLAFYDADFNSFYDKVFWYQYKDLLPEVLAEILTIPQILFFQDVDLAEWYAPYVYFGLLEGLTPLDTHFRPGDKIARAEIAKWVVLGHEKFHGEGAGSLCDQVNCVGKEYCDPGLGVCVSSAKCVPTEGNPCPIGGGGGGGNPEPGTCPNEDGLYCGEEVELTPGSIYQCVDGKYTESEICAHGCVDTIPSEDAYCDKGDSDSCPEGDGLYCGESVGLTKGTLYSCSSGIFTQSKVCDEGCADGGNGKNDYCENAPCDCNSGPCCDGCSFRPSNYVCEPDAESEYGCIGNGCGADVSIRTRNRKCSGSSASCSGALGTWEESVYDSCSSDETCSAGDSSCNSDAMCCTDTYTIESYKCNTYTSANGGGEIMEVCGLVDANGKVTVKVRKYDGTDFGSRPYQVRVSAISDDPCGPDTYNFVVSDSSPSGVGTDQLTFGFDSIWLQGQTDKAYCVTASTTPNDGGYDPNSNQQKSWWYSDKFELNKSCQ